MSDIGRTTACNVSGYDRARVHQSRLVQGEKRALVANFNGAMQAGRTIVSARWRCESTPFLVMENATITTDKRSTAVDITAAWLGCAMVLCEATLDNGEVYTQMFSVEVSGNPWFVPATTSPGPTELVATA